MNKNNKGFTLIELLVVVAIIGTLAAVGVVAYNGYTSAAKKNATKAIHANMVKYIGSELAKCNLGVAPTVFMGVRQSEDDSGGSGNEEGGGEEGGGGESGGSAPAASGASADDINCDTNASDLVDHLTSTADSPLQDRDPHSTSGELAFEGSVAITASGSAIKIVTSYDPDDTDLTLENEIEVE